MSNTPAAEQQTFEQQVNSAVEALVQTTEGNWQFPETFEAPEEVKYAANLEKRRRDTQSAYSKSQQSLKQLEAENRKLAEAWYADASAKMTLEQREELDTLKHDDPDAWHTKLQELETASKSSFENKRAEISKKAQTESEEDYRTRLFTEFEQANPGLVINDEVLATEVPPKYLKKLEKGEYTFVEFLEACKVFLTAGKTINPGEQAPNDVSLSKIGGRVTPEDSAVDKAAASSYANETY